jgi:hypothetical protein
MNTRYMSIVLSGLGVLLLLGIFVYPLSAQSPGPGSEPVVPAEGAEVESPAQMPLSSTIPVTALGRSAPIPLDGKVSEAEKTPTFEEAAPFQANASQAASIIDFRIAGTALKPRGNDVDYIPAAGGGCFYASAGNSFRVFNTGVYLPQGSNILAMRMYYDDTSSSNSRAWFSVYDLYGDLVEEWSVDSVGDTGNGFNDTDTISHTIDYLSYSYVINWRPYDLGFDTQLCGFRIFYQPPPFGAVFLPLVLKG